MSFKPFGFTFTPPRTVQAPPPESVPTSPASLVVGVGGAASGSQSNAGDILSQLNDLTAMSQYLQDAIVARTGNTAIEIDASIDPVTARALSAIYSPDVPPTSVTIAMYDHLLDAQMGALQLEMAVGTDSTIQTNPMQVADLTTVINTVNDHLIQSPSYANWLPLQLASLKADSIVFQSWAASLSTYPAYYAAQPSANLQSSIIQASTLDINDSLYQYQSDVTVRFSQSYTAVYRSLATVSSVERDVGSVIGQFVVQPLSNMLRIASLLTSLVGLSHKPNMASIQGDLINYTFARLASDVSGMLHICDQVVSLAVSPLQGNLGALGQIIAGVQQQAARLGMVASGGLAGMSNSNSCASSNPSNKASVGVSLSIPGLGIISEGLKQVAETINWGQNQLASGLSLLDKSFRQLIEHRLAQQNDRQSLMCSMKALDLIIGLAKGVAHELQKGTVTANSTTQQIQESANRILTSLQTGSNTTFVASGNQIIVNPSDMPAVTRPVQNVLNKGNIRTTTRPIQS